MSRKAKILNGVVDSISLATETDPEWINCPDDVYAGHLYDGTTFVAPPSPPPPTLAEKNTEITKTLDQHFGPDTSEDAKVRNLIMADMFMKIDNTLTKRTSLIQVRINYEVHLRAIRGI